MGGMNDNDVLLARAYLSRVAEPANAAVWALVRKCGPLEAAERIRSGDVDEATRAATEARRRVADPDPYVADRVRARHAAPDKPRVYPAIVAGLLWWVVVLAVAAGLVAAAAWAVS